MKSAIQKSLSISILKSIAIDEIIYAEITPEGAMGNSGGIIIYIPKKDTNELICYQTNIYEDEDAYTFAENLFSKNMDIFNTDLDDKSLYFNCYNGGMGNIVFINKKVNLVIQNDCFIYSTEHHKFKIYSSVQGVFYSVVSQLQKDRN